MKYQRETLVAELRERGITYLAPSDASTDEVLPSSDALFAAILDQEDSRLRLALVPLFIRHPALAESISRLSKQLDVDSALELQTLYMAAVYLQRFWKTRLGLYLSDMVLLPDLFSQQLGLSSPEVYFGKIGLYDLADAWQERSRYPFNRLVALNNTVDLFFEQLSIEWSQKYHAT